MRIISLFVFASLLNLLSAAEEFSYDDQEEWPNLPNSSCGESRQSPINVVTSNLEGPEYLQLEELVMENWDNSLEGEWKNNGHNLQFNPDETSATITTYFGEYELLQFHFHWGVDDTQGSEHRVDEKQYSGELHFVHKTTDSSLAATSGYYYTVVGVLLEADEDASYEGIWYTLGDEIPEYEESVNVSNINYMDMLPDDLSYYYYNGSLTTPSCNEIVQWVLLQQPLSVPVEFFEKIRTTPTNSSTLTHNFRDTQELNGRTVYQYPSSGGTLAIPTIALLLVSILITFAAI